MRPKAQRGINNGNMEKTFMIKSNSENGTEDKYQS